MSNNASLEEISYPFHDQELGLGCRCKMPEGGSCGLMSIDVLRNWFRTHGDVCDGELLACYEGVYKWDQTVKDYVWVGQISKVVTKKVVELLENYAVLSRQNKIIHLKPNEVYTVRRESTTYFDDSEAETRLLLQSERSDLFAIVAYSESSKIETLDGMCFYERDYAIISRVAEPAPIEYAADYIPF